jgi:hypothetical protein
MGFNGFPSGLSTRVCSPLLLLTRVRPEVGTGYRGRRVVCNADPIREKQLFAGKVAFVGNGIIV